MPKHSHVRVRVRALTEWWRPRLRDAPYDLTPEFTHQLKDEYKIDYIVHGDDPCITVRPTHPPTDAHVLLPVPSCPLPGACWHRMTLRTPCDCRPHVRYSATARTRTPPPRSSVRRRRHA